MWDADCQAEFISNHAHSQSSAPPTYDLSPFIITWQLRSEWQLLLLLQKGENEINFMILHISQLVNTVIVMQFPTAN